MAEYEPETRVTIGRVFRQITAMESHTVKLCFVLLEHVKDLKKSPTVIYIIKSKVRLDVTYLQTMDFICIEWTWNICVSTFIFNIHCIYRSDNDNDEGYEENRE